MFDENTPGAKEELFAWLRHMNKYFQTNRRIFFHQRMQLRHQPTRYQPLPCQCNGSTRCDCIGIPLHYQQYP